jgi:hypothetical protein
MEGAVAGSPIGSRRGPRAMEGAVAGSEAACLHDAILGNRRNDNPIIAPVAKSNCFHTFPHHRS